MVSGVGGIFSSGQQQQKKNQSSQSTFVNVHMNVVPRNTMNTNGETEN